jgi:hypothetical protein
MESLKTLILSANREHTDKYFQGTWMAFHVLTAELRTKPLHPAAGMRAFAEYETMELQRLRKNLEDVRYYIDGSDTLQLILGYNRRIEKVRSYLK